MHLETGGIICYHGEYVELKNGAKWLYFYFYIFFCEWHCKEMQIKRVLINVSFRAFKDLDV